MADRILVPYDGSPPSTEALEYSFETFPDAAVTAFYVAGTPGEYWRAFRDPADGPTADEIESRGREILETAGTLAAEHGHDIETEVVTGQPDREIVSEAEAGSYEAIVMGSHGREGVSRILLGSVAETVVRRAPIPVIVVR